MSFAHAPDCNVVHVAGPEPCPPRCDDAGHLDRPACASCGSRFATGGIVSGPLVVDLGQGEPEVQSLIRRIVRSGSAPAGAAPEPVSRGLGWCWHRWPKWGPVENMWIRNRLGEGIEQFQQRTCTKCGAVRQREVTY